MDIFFPDQGLDVARALLLVVAALAAGVWSADVWTKRRVRRMAQGAGMAEDGERALRVLRLDSFLSRAARWVSLGSIVAYLLLSLVHAVA